MNFLATCAAIIMINNTNLPWNSHDLEMRDRAVIHCAQNSMCLSKFHKRGFQSYFGWCKTK